MRNNDLRMLIESVRDKTDICEIISECITLSNNNKALCPFHDDRNPSLSVNSDNQYFHCFGCGVGGDVFTFLMLHEGKDFMTVLRELANKAGVEFPDFSPEDCKQLEEYKIVESILTDSAKFYHDYIPEEARKYLTEIRGITNDSLEQFNIGFAGGGLKNHLIDELGYPVNLCLKAGVLKQSNDGAIKDYFYGRIIFPNMKRGRVVHISGRSLDGRKPKYLHLRGEISYLYNENVLMNSEVCVAEGIPDCISTVQAGFAAVGIYGANNFKPEQVQKFTRCQKIFLCLDGDNAGREAAIKIGKLFGERARIVQLPDGQDINDFLRSGTRDDFKQLIDSSLDLINYELSQIPPETDKTELPDKLKSILTQLAQMDRVKVEAYLNYTIKQRFKLNQRDMDGYRELVANYKNNHTQKKQESNKVEYTAIFDDLVDIVNDDGVPAFLVMKEDVPVIMRQIELDGITYVPPPRKQIPWHLPRGREVLKYYTQQQSESNLHAEGILFDDLVTYHKFISELPSDDHYDLIAAWDFHTYLQESSEYTPIICLFSVPERGKSRTGKGMAYVAYRGIHVESLRDAYLVRAAHDLNATIFFDVKDIWRKAEKYGSEDILLHRYERGAKVPRVLYPDRGPHRDTVYFSIFGPTIIGTNESVHKILETRAIQINMPQTSKRFENDVKPEMALEFKERLVAFRARHLKTALPEIAKPASGRLGDILRPLQRIIRMVRPEKEKTLMQLIKNIEDERLVEKADSLEAQILKVVIVLEDEVDNGMLPVKRITDQFNEDRSEKKQVSYALVGRRLSAMGFNKTKATDGASAILWDEQKIRVMEAAYGLRKTSVTSVRSVSSETKADDTDVSDGTDVLSNASERDSARLFCNQGGNG